MLLVDCACFLHSRPASMVTSVCVYRYYYQSVFFSWISSHFLSVVPALSTFISKSALSYLWQSSLTACPELPVNNCLSTTICLSVAPFRILPLGFASEEGRRDERRKLGTEEKNVLNKKTFICQEQRGTSSVEIKNKAQQPSQVSYLRDS